MHIKHTLEAAGHVVVSVVWDVDTAVGAAATLPFDLALVDYSLANGSCGADAIRILRERYSRPSIFVSSDPENCRAAWKRAGALGCLQKPFTEGELERTVEIAAELIAGKEPSALGDSRFEIYAPSA